MVWLLCCTLCLAAQQRYFEIELLQPARITLPASRPAVQRVLVVNNAALQPEAFGHKNKRNDSDTGNASVDLSTAARQCLFGAVEGLEQTALYDEVSVLDRQLNPKKSFYKRSPISAQQADSLMTFYDVDAILSLNQLVLYDVMESYLTDADTYFAYLQAYCNSQWSIHYRGGQTASFAYADTLLWSEESRSEVEALMALPDRQVALIDMANYVGRHAVASLYPQWVTAERYLYYAASSEMETALQLFTRQDWAAALSVWQTIANKSANGPILRAYAMADMALCSEMMGDFDAAIRSTEQAIEQFKQVHTTDAAQQRVNLSYYKEQLNQRKLTK